MSVEPFRFGRPYSRWRPARVAPGPEFRERAAAKLRELGETPEGQLVYVVVQWARRQLDDEAAAAEPQALARQTSRRGRQRARRRRR